MVLASEQFVQLAHTVLRAKASEPGLAVIFPGNPSYASLRELEGYADDALEQVVERLRNYPG